MNKYVLTGGPCTGKTTILNKLTKRGFNAIPEIAREVIKKEQLKEKRKPGYKGVFPHTNIHEFENIVINKQLSYEKRIPKGAAFLDRSLIDILAYAKLRGIDLGTDLYPHIRKANYTKIFFLEQLPFFIQDKERKEDLKKAKKIHRELYNIYKKLGFKIIRVPVMGVEERESFILKHIK